MFLAMNNNCDFANHTKGKRKLFSLFYDWFWYPKLERETKSEWERDKKNINIDSSNDCKNFIDIAKLAEQVDCYDEMVDAVKKMLTLNVELTLKGRHLFFTGYKNVIGARKE